jgi:hypothetical protein
MADPSDFIKVDKSKEKQVIGGQQSHRSEYGRQGDQTEESGGERASDDSQAVTSSAPPRSTGTHGTEFGQINDYDRSGQQGQSGTGQADLGNQAGSTLSGRTDQQDLGTDQPGRVAGAGAGFILQEDNGTESASSAMATGGSDFAPQGRGATEDEEEDGSEGHPS